LTALNGTSASATAYRYVTRQPGVRSGHAIIEGTRLGVHDVIEGGNPSSLGREAPEFRTKKLDGKV
jgi:hypothetical protein